MNAVIKPAPIITLPAYVPATTVVHMARALLPESKGESAEELRAAMVLRANREPQVWLEEDLEGNEP
jgi:hypothetical protein